jgi:hypothetical protein
MRRDLHGISANVVAFNFDSWSFCNNRNRLLGGNKFINGRHLIIVERVKLPESSEDRSQSGQKIGKLGT